MDKTFWFCVAFGIICIVLVFAKEQSRKSYAVDGYEWWTATAPKSSGNGVGTIMRLKHPYAPGKYPGGVALRIRLEPDGAVHVFDHKGRELVLGEGDRLEEIVARKEAEGDVAGAAFAEAEVARHHLKAFEFLHPKEQP